MTSVDTQGASRAGSFGEGLRSWVSVLPLSHFAMGLEQVTLVHGAQGLPERPSRSNRLRAPRQGAHSQGTHSSIPQMFAGWVPVPGAEPGVRGSGEQLLLGLRGGTHRQPGVGEKNPQASMRPAL